MITRENPAASKAAPAASKVVYNNLQEEILEWRIRGMTASEETYFNAHFDLSSGLLKKAGKRVAQHG